MKQRWTYGAVAAVAAAMAISSTPVAGQQARPAAGKKYVAPRTPDGHPDLSGVWANNDATPLERPDAFQGRALLTDGEVEALKKRAGELFNGETDAAFGDSVYLAVIQEGKGFKSTDTTGNYNHFWIVDREFDNRTSVVSSPEDGKIPALTQVAKDQLAKANDYKKAHPADGPEDLTLRHRCITYGAPRLEAGYNSYFQIYQSKDTVAIGQEMIHDVRLIPTDGRPQISNNIRQWLGSSRGHWEGDTLVVETSNYNAKTQMRNLPSDAMKVTERFTRVGEKTLQWDVTVNDAANYTQPWTATVILRHSPEPIFEMACHEGNEALAGALRGERVLERERASGKVPTNVSK